MELQVSGKLKTATAQQLSFSGFRIEALFHRERAPAVSSDRIAAAFHRKLALAASSDRIAASSATSTSADARIPDRVSALSDDNGKFKLVLPAQHEIATKTVKFTVFSPAGGIVRQMEVMTADLGKEITIEVDVGSFDKVEPKLYTPQSVAVDALFRTDAAFRHAITENLKPLRGQSEAVAARVEKAWNFRPSRLSAEELATRHYAAPGSDPSEVLHTVIMGGVDALRSAKTERALSLRNSAELKKLIKNKDSGDSSHGVVELGPLIEFIQRRGAGPIQGAELTSTPYVAEAEAEAILGAIDNKDGAPVARQQALTANALEAKELVTKTVNKQMESATAPEAELAYGKIPNSADEDQAQKSILDTFELRKGPTDVPSYHDFHTLQIAFEHVWTEIFDGQLETLGRELYEKYVDLKAFTGSAEPDFTVTTPKDLQRLMGEIKKLTEFAEAKTPGGVPEMIGSSGNSNGNKDNTLGDAGIVLSGGLTLFMEWVFKELHKLGQVPLIYWNLFGGPLPRNPPDYIDMTAEPGVVPEGFVEISLKTDQNSHFKQLQYQYWNRDTTSFFKGESIDNGGNNYLVTKRFTVSAMDYGLLEFVSEVGPNDNRTHYRLGDLTLVLKDQTRVTFYWKGA